VTALVPVFFFFWTFDVPAVLMLAFWFIGQFFTGIASISNAAAAGNVAVWAHVAGFLIGVAIGLVLPRGSAPGRAGPVVRRADGPGPARLVASAADLCALILGARIVLLFLGVRPGFGLLGPLARLAYDVTEPFVRPFAELIPTLLLVGRPLDLPAIVLLVLIYALAGWLAGLVGGGRPRPAY
jgi:membrane associated rhomboid family serine protease